MITPFKVHLAIQEMNNKLPAYDNVISINDIADELHVNIDELTVHINTLKNLAYLNYTDRFNNKIRLTNNGIYTTIPHPA